MAMSDIAFLPWRSVHQVSASLSISSSPLGWRNLQGHGSLTQTQSGSPEFNSLHSRFNFIQSSNCSSLNARVAFVVNCFGRGKYSVWPVAEKPTGAESNRSRRSAVMRLSSNGDSGWRTVATRSEPAPPDNSLHPLWRRCTAPSAHQCKTQRQPPMLSLGSRCSLECLSS